LGLHNAYSEKTKKVPLIDTSFCIYNPYSLAYTGVAFQVWWKLN
jgi:hypothetical protein